MYAPCVQTMFAALKDKSHIQTHKRPLLSNMEDCEISIWLL